MLNLKHELFQVISRRYMNPTSQYSVSTLGSSPVKYVLHGMKSTELEAITEEVFEVFTQHHYEILAGVIDKRMQHLVKEGAGSEQKAVTEFVNDLVKTLELDNPKFKKFLFIERAFGPSNALRNPKEKT